MKSKGQVHSRHRFQTAIKYVNVMNFMVQKMEYIFMMKEFKFMNLQFDVCARFDSF